MSDFEAYLTEDARLVMLRALHAETSRTLNDTLLQKVLETYGHNRSREFVRTQLRKLGELGAVRVREAGTVLIAELLRAGADHVENRAVIDGIARPSPAA
jgi:hypothetical protein